ncbi:hypothetical protein M405DRAFT_869635 [Rhizopogon salebrosus TDB-379]|nr:hypothetical protein M405DRAFT_869635 [Rhizopogon salebrosus TDB-379]
MRQFDVLMPRAVIQHYHLSYPAHLRNKDLYQETHRNTLSFAISHTVHCFIAHTSHPLSFVAGHASGMFIYRSSQELSTHASIADQHSTLSDAHLIQNTPQPGNLFTQLIRRRLTRTKAIPARIRLPN